MNSATKPLSGYRILDLTNVLAGPFCCHQLAHMGAEVIKIEAPGSGDLARQLGADPQLNQKNMGISFLAQNAGKKSITINLKSGKGKKLFLKLINNCSAIVENFRPGVMKRLELDYEILKKSNPTLIYCAISGFGQDGPLSSLPAYDQIIQGMSGIMSITGDAQTAPYRVGSPIADTIGGMTAAFAISSALASRSKTGCFIDISMLEATMATMGWVISNNLLTGIQPQPQGNQNITACPSGTFKTKQGLLNIAANKQQQFEAVCDVLGRTELKQDSRFAHRQNRLDNRAELNKELEQSLTKKPAEYWQKKLNDAGVPAGCVMSVPEALDHPQIQQRGMIGKFEDIPGAGKNINLVRTAIKINRSPLSVDTPPPQLGQNTKEICMELGYSDSEIDEMYNKAII